MAKPYLLYFTAEDHYLYSASRSGLEFETRLSGDELGLAEFRNFLRRRPNCLISFVADVAGEDFHEDQIPFLRGADRRAVVERRLAQRYRDTRLAAALSLGTVLAGERRNERLLLASFTNTQPFALWLDALEQCGARLAGFFSVPLLAPALAARLGGSSGRCLIVSAHKAGLRQCFVEDGRLRFARLERAVEMVPQALAMFVRSETLRLAQYLMTLRALPREGAAVNVLVVSPKGQREVFEQVLSSDARLSFRVVDLDEAARNAGLRRQPQNTGAEALYLFMAGRKPPAQQFATQDDRRRFYIWQLQRAIAATGAAGLAACALYAGALTLETSRVRDQIASQADAARAAAREYERISASFPVTQTSSENLKITVDEFQRLAQRSAAPENALVHISRVLEQFPNVEIDAIQWRAGVGDDRDRRTVRPPASSGAADNAPPPGVRVELTGRINTAGSDYRAIAAHVQRFGEALASDGYELVRTQLPFDITPEGTLTGEMIGNAGREAARFTLLLRRGGTS